MKKGSLQSYVPNKITQNILGEDSWNFFKILNESKIIHEDYNTDF